MARILAFSPVGNHLFWEHDHVLSKRGFMEKREVEVEGEGEVELGRELAPAVMDD